MPRRRRFNILKGALKTLRNPLADPNDPVDLSVLPAGSILKNFADYQAGTRTVSYPRDPASKPGQLIPKAILPFALLNTDNQVLVQVSQRAITALGTLSLSALDLNMDDPTTEIPREGFVPAKAVIFKASASQVTAKVDSKITGRKYDPKEGASYTYPFGQKAGGTGAGDLTYAGVAAGITASLAADESVSFEPEYFPV